MPVPYKYHSTDHIRWFAQNSMPHHFTVGILKLRYQKVYGQVNFRYHFKFNYAVLSLKKQGILISDNQKRPIYSKAVISKSPYVTKLMVGAEYIDFPFKTTIS